VPLSSDGTPSAHGWPSSVAWDLVEQLPNPFRDEVRKKFNRPHSDAGPAWIEAFVKHIQAWAVVAADAFASQGRDPSVAAERAAKLQEVAAQHWCLMNGWTS
jgi:hypothetical protein